eukprot:366212-Chlamydomonas_euryale.AAC.53
MSDKSTMAIRESGAKAVYLTPQVPQHTAQHENLGNRAARSTYRPSSHLSQTHLEMEVRYSMLCLCR